ncbi:MAG: hypothetical protein AB1414_15285 [bacterium]
MTELPIIYQHTFYSYIPQEQEEEKERLFALGNIEFTPRYSFKWKDKTMQVLLGIQIPTLNKIAGNLPYTETEEQMRFFEITPEIGISKVYDPIIGTIRFSFSQPLWREKEKENVRSLWKSQLGSDFYFIINEKFSLFSNLALISQKSKEDYLFQIGTSYNPKPYQEWQIYLLNDYNGITWQGSLGISFNLFKKK